MRQVFYVVATVLVAIGATSAQSADPAEDQACKELKYVDLQLRMINLEKQDPTDATLSKLAQVDSNPCPAERRPGNDALYRQLYNARVNKGGPVDCSPERFTEISALEKQARRYVSTVGPYAAEQQKELYKACKSEINFDTAREKIKWDVTNPIDAALLSQLTNAVYDEMPDDYSAIPSSTFEKGFRDSFLGMIGALDSDYNSEMEKIKDICKQFEDSMDDSYPRLSQFNGTPEEFEGFNDMTEDSIKEVRVCEQAQTVSTSAQGLSI